MTPAELRAGWDARDAEVEGLRAERDVARSALRAMEQVENGRIAELETEVEELRADLVAAQREAGHWMERATFTEAAVVERDALRQTLADREDVARVLRDADRPDVPAHLPPSRNYVDMAVALMERFTITDGGGSR